MKLQYKTYVEKLVEVLKRKYGDRFISLVVFGKGRLKELISKRVRMGKKWDWVLKPDYRFGEIIEIE